MIMDQIAALDRTRHFRRLTILRRLSQRIGCMQKSASLIAGLVILCGCSHDASDLKKLATDLEQPWPGSTLVSMTMTVRESGGHPVLHCRLQNPYWKALALDRSRLPWRLPLFFVGTVVTSTGRTFAIAATTIAYISGPPDPFLIGPAEVVEGDFELKYLPKNARVGPPMPRNQDALLLWSYGLPTYGETPPQELSKYNQKAMQSVTLTGITFLPRRAMELLDR
jgi:hypothetical protein